ncbi:hypothetical protein SARC_08184 [Sphaeroforma arctica JP610]|uniref:Pentacotripeptide-repeat region of PRORP domain-containing protein n=1 Tax=Sphaeroforma arctica JP610 TaxID=667725 RepID=A0A0L0FRN2_9EUKA|nr:hypothetical protein SARC_08184 [Sphaeroforma arctica JP610]KNC79430.1 hypothetical protein SARC_08184 [Sphaeroforma arctica JP610]|eukprot:XP_014153332.1 hypothetical protein SARC_08184 [Sphaeroforma arctica JP610]
MTKDTSAESKKPPGTSSRQAHHTNRPSESHSKNIVHKSAPTRQTNIVRPKSVRKTDNNKGASGSRYSYTKQKASKTLTATSGSASVCVQYFSESSRRRPNKSSDLMSRMLRTREKYNGKEAVKRCLRSIRATDRSKLRPEHYEFAMRLGMQNYCDRSVFNLYYSATKEHSFTLSGESIKLTLQCAERCDEVQVVRHVLQTATNIPAGGTLQYVPFFRAANFLCRRGKHLDLLSDCLQRVSANDDMFMLTNARRIASMSEPLLSGIGQIATEHSNYSAVALVNSSVSAQPHTVDAVTLKRELPGEQALSATQISDDVSTGSSLEIHRMTRSAEVDRYFDALGISKMMSIYISLGMWSAARNLLDYVGEAVQRNTHIATDSAGPSVQAKSITPTRSSSIEGDVIPCEVVPTDEYFCNFMDIGQLDSQGAARRVVSSRVTTLSTDAAYMVQQIDEILEMCDNPDNGDGHIIHSKGGNKTNYENRQNTDSRDSDLLSTNNADWNSKQVTRSVGKQRRHVLERTPVETSPATIEDRQSMLSDILRDTSNQVENLREALLFNISTRGREARACTDAKTSVNDCKAQIASLQNEIEDLKLKSEILIMRHFYTVMKSLPTETSHLSIRTTESHQLEMQDESSKSSALFTFLQVILNPCDGRSIGLDFDRKTLVDMFRLTVNSLSRSGYWQEVVFLIEDMREKHMVPPLAMFEKAMYVCGTSDQWTQVLHLHSSLQVVHPHETDPMILYQGYLNASVSCEQWGALYRFARCMPALGIVPTSELAKLLLSLSELSSKRSKQIETMRHIPITVNTDAQKANTIAENGSSPVSVAREMDVGLMVSLLGDAGFKLRPKHIYELMTHSLEREQNHTQCICIFESGMKALPTHVGENACSPAYTDGGERTCKYIDAITTMAFESYISTHKWGEAGNVWLGIAAQEGRPLNCILKSEMWEKLFTKLIQRHRSAPVACRASAAAPIAELIYVGLTKGLIRTESEYTRALTWCGLVQDGTLTTRLLHQMRLSLRLTPSAGNLKNVLTTLYECQLYKEYTELYENSDKAVSWAGPTVEYSVMLMDCYFALEDHVKAIQVLRMLHAQ